MKEVTFGLTSLNDSGHGFKINITFHPTMPGKCDFDLTYMFDGEETEECAGVLMEHDDLERLLNLLNNARSESYKRRLEDDEFFGDYD